MSRFSQTQRFAPPTTDVPGPGDYSPKEPGGTTGGAFFVKSGRFDENVGNPELGPGKYFDADGNVVASQMDIDAAKSHGTKIRARSRAASSRSSAASGRLTSGRSGSSQVRVPACAFARGRSKSGVRAPGAAAKDGAVASAKSARGARGAGKRRRSSSQPGWGKGDSRHSSKAKSKPGSSPTHSNQKPATATQKLEESIERITADASRAKEQFEAKVNEMENELKQGQETLNAIEAEKHTLEQERDALRVRLEDAEAGRERDVGAYEEKLQQAQTEMEALKERIASLDASQQEERARFEAQLKEKEQEVAQHGTTLRELRSTHSDEKAALQREAKELTTRIDAKASECDLERRRYAALASEKAALEGRFEELENNLTSNQTIRSTQRLKIQELEDVREHLEREARERKNSSDILRARVVELEASLKDEREKTSHHKHDFERITSVFNESQLKIQRQEEQSVKLARANKRLEGELDALKQGSDALEREVAERDDALRAAKAKYESEAEQSAKKAEVEKNALQSECDQLKEKADSLHERVIALLASQTDVSNALKEVTSQRDECQAALEETRALVSHQQQTIKEMGDATADQAKNNANLKKELEVNRSMLHEAKRREARHEEERDTLAQEIESGKSLHSHLTERAEGLTDELNRLQEANASLEDENTDLKTAKQALQAQVAELHSENQTTHEKLVEERAELSKQCQALSRDAAAKNAEWQSVSAQLTRAREELSDERRQTELLKGEREALNASASARASENAELKQKLKSREEEMRASADQAAQLEERHKESAARLSHELTRLREDLDLKRRELSEKCEANNELAAVREALETELHAVTQRERDTHAKLSERTAALEQTRERLTEATGTRDSLQSEVASLRSDHEQLVDTSSTLKKQLAALKVSHAASEQRVADLEGDLASRSAKCAAVEQRLKAVEENSRIEMEKQQGAYASLNEKFARVGDEYASARRDASQWQAQFRALQKENEKAKLLRGKLHRAGHEMEVQESLLSQRSKKIEEYERELGIATRRIRSQSEQIGELESQKARLSSENVALKSTNIDREMEIETMRRREQRTISQTSTESASSSSSSAHSTQLVLRSSTDGAGDASSGADDMRTKYDRAHTNERKYRMRYEESQKALLQTQDKLESLRSSYDQLLGEQSARRSSDRQDDADAEIARLRAEIARLQKKAARREKTPAEQQAAAKIAELQQQLQAQHSHADSLQVEVSSIEGKYVQIYGEHHRLKQRFASVAKLEKEVERLKEENAKLIGHTNRNQKISLLHEYRAEITKLKGELVDARTDNVKLKKRCHLLANRHQSSAASSSAAASSSSGSGALTASTLSSAARQRENLRSPRQREASSSSGGALGKPKAAAAPASGKAAAAPDGEVETHKENVSPNRA